MWVFELCIENVSFVKRVWQIVQFKCFKIYFNIWDESRNTKIRNNRWMVLFLVLNFRFLNSVMKICWGRSDLVDVDHECVMRSCTILIYGLVCYCYLVERDVKRAADLREGLLDRVRVGGRSPTQKIKIKNANVC